MKIEVHDAFPVCGCERGGDLFAEAQDLLDRQWPADETLGERFAVHVLHDQEGVTVLLTDIMQGTDMRMVQSRDRAGFTFEAFEAVASAEFGPAKDLQSDGAIQTRVARSIHFAHAPDAEGALDRVWTQLTTRFQRHERQEVYSGWVDRVASQVSWRPQSIPASESLVSQTFASWNHIVGWLRRLEGLRGTA